MNRSEGLQSVANELDHCVLRMSSAEHPSIADVSGRKPSLENYDQRAIPSLGPRSPSHDAYACQTVAFVPYIRLLSGPEVRVPHLSLARKLQEIDAGGLEAPFLLAGHHAHLHVNCSPLRSPVTYL